jgi:hypothetical protein
MAMPQRSINMENKINRYAHAVKKILFLRQFLKSNFQVLGVPAR